MRIPQEPTLGEIIFGGMLILTIIIMWATCPWGLP
jgi:hypothetical protein